MIQQSTQTKTFTYKDELNKSHTQTLSGDILAFHVQADKDYETARSYIMKECYYIWRYAYKAYHLSTQDRKSRISDTSLTSNIAFGFIRAFIDVFTSTLAERPIVFNATAFDEKGLKNKDTIIKYLSAINDINNFTRESKKILAEGLKTGMFAVRVGYKPPTTPVTYTYIYNNVPVEDTYTPEIGDIPYAEHVDVFKIFPDPGSGNLSYITERDVVTIDTALKIFSNLINHKSNKSPLKDPTLIKNLTLNSNGAIKTDYGSVRNEVHAEINERLRAEDTTSHESNTQPQSTSLRQDEDRNITDNRVEYRYYVSNAIIVLTINNYPVYIGPNIYGFIPYVVRPTNTSDVRMGVEGVPYLLEGVEKVVNGYMNQYLDNVDTVSRPNLIAKKGAFIDESALQRLETGEVLFVDGDVNSVLKPIERQQITDFNILDICSRIANQITGISEYNLGQSARERTATGANAVSQSSQKRLSPYLESYMMAMSQIAKMQVMLAVKFYQKGKKLVIDDAIEMFKSNKLAGSVNITLELDSIFASVNELQSKRLMEMFSLLRGTNLIKEDEFTKQILESQGLSPTKLVPESAPEVTPPKGETLLPAPTPISEEPTPNNAEIPTQLREAVTPQLNLQ